MEKDYVVEIRIKNNHFVRHMRSAGFKTGAELARAAGVPIQYLHQYIALKRTPIGPKGEFRDDIIKIADILNCIPSELFPPQHLEKCLKTNKASFAADLMDVGAYLTGNQDTAKMAIEYIVDRENVDELFSMMHVLTHRERDVIERRFGLNDRPEETLDQIGKSYNVTQGVIRQNEARALWKIKRQIRIKGSSLRKDAKIVSSMGSHAKPNHYVPEWKKEEIREKLENYQSLPSFRLFSKYMLDQ